MLGGISWILFPLRSRCVRLVRFSNIVPERSLIPVSERSNVLRLIRGLNRSDGKLLIGFEAN